MTHQIKMAYIVIYTTFNYCVRLKNLWTTIDSNNLVFSLVRVSPNTLGIK